MNLTDAHRQGLLCLRSLARRRTDTTVSAIAETARRTTGSDVADWSAVLRELQAGGLAAIAGEVYSLTAEGALMAEDLHRKAPLWAYLYREVHTRAPDSATYGKLCERVFGQNLCQQGQADMEQLDALVDRLEIEPHHRVLDLGCGNGLITAYIAHRTGGHVTGVDLSPDGIAYAKQHVKTETGTATFEVANINELAYARSSFDRIVSIDTLHFAADLQQTLVRLAGIITPEGRMGVFWETWIRPEKQSRDLLKPSGTRLGRTLTALEWSYETIDFSAQNDALWARMKAVLGELEPAFRAEKNELLFESVTSQTRRTEWGIGSRYLYTFRPAV